MEYKFKIIILGNFSSGKTSIVKRIKDESFYDTYTSTIGVDFIRKRYDHIDLFDDVMTLEDGCAAYEISKEDTLIHFTPQDSRFKKYHKAIKSSKKEDNQYLLSIWDTSGQEKFSTITTAYFRKVSACVLVFDITNYSSFSAVQAWHRDLLEKLDQSERSYFPLILVGNKCDLEKSRAVTKLQAQELANKLDCTYIECSAKENINITQIFSELIRDIHFKINHELIIPNPNNGMNILSRGIDLFPIYKFELDDQEGISPRCCNIM
jgi:Ras-related protein Rab-8A